MDAITFILFGATGDLAQRKIIPALYSLFVEQKLPPAFSFIGTSLTDLSDDEFHQHIRRAIHTFSDETLCDEKMKHFLEIIRYCKVDVTKEDEYKKLLELVRLQEKERDIPENRMFYMSVAPAFFDVIALHIKNSGLGTTRGWKRLIIEKPFGHDLKSAQELNKKLSTAFKEEEIFRIDHYLGKPMVQNLEALEFANPIFQTLWNNQHIANIQITASETVGVESRASYYDKAGAIRDMFQNHMLQLLMMTGMHLPKRITPEDISNEKRKIIESIRPLKITDVGRDVIRGQYQSGEIIDKHVVGYREEPGVDPASTTDTFVAVRLWIDDPFWKGVPFYIRTGKRMKQKSTRIVIEFKNSLKELYPNQEQPTPNLLVIGINPNEGISLQLNSKNPLKDGKIEPITIDFKVDEVDVPKAYELLLLDAFQGDSTFFAHWSEVEKSWEWVQPILEAFDDNLIPLHFYPSGSFGPAASHKLLEENGFGWWLDKHTLEAETLKSGQ
ncbi:glucose-6-phosphate dehydrogenase [Bacillus sp. SA1-12]|uniref:glucose-6-phosphate dehydrogenase n=1 Tax=Bacillus sp. SA1-12 TaxID=1455638 RepID=UPI000626F8F0|nr:glucose-6-phosphate dehydrogenase [Bacillus sp. SA1-12]KKI90308.1 glucose-6-phosphate dehydrogenase [Bacillus sp. SA1-12]